VIVEALLIQLPKTEGQPRIYRRNRNIINRSSVASPLASHLASYLASPVDHSRNVAYSQQIRKTVELDPIREKNESLPRSGKPRDIARQLERRILRFGRRFPKFTYKKVRLGVLTTLSKASIHRILKKEGITNWICKKRPFLTSTQSRLVVHGTTKRMD
jgi:hypothetical protein